MLFYYVQDVYQKNQPRSRLDKIEESRFTTQGWREVEVGTLFLGNDKNNVIANKLFFVIFSK